MLGLAKPIRQESSHLKWLVVRVLLPLVYFLLAMIFSMQGELYLLTRYKMISKMVC